MKFTKTKSGFNLQIFHGHTGIVWGRTHHAEIVFGLWRHCLTGVQLFAGPLDIVINWSIKPQGSKRGLATCIITTECGIKVLV